MDEDTIVNMIQDGKLGLSRQESRLALRKLGKKRVDGNLNDVRAARIAAAREFRRVSENSTANPFDRSSPVTEGAIAYAPPAVRGSLRDAGTGKAVRTPKEVAEVWDQEALNQQEGKAYIPVAGPCSQEPSRAINDLEDLVRTKVENGLVSGPDEGFFLFLYSLFFNKNRRSSIPSVISGVTVDPKSIATFHKGDPGGLTFDCRKFVGLGPVLQRKIVCHELYHKYDYGAGEAPAYAIMPKC